MDPGETAALSPEAIDALCQAIAHRRSLGVARLKPDSVDPALIKRALEAANWAPSHGDTEPWRFTIYTGEGRRVLGEAFAAAYKSEADRDNEYKQNVFEGQRNRVWSAPVWISIGMEPALNPDGSLMMPLEEEIMAVASAAQNLHLVMAAQGLVGMWLSKGVLIHPQVGEFVGLTAPHARLFGFFVFGWPNIPLPAGERRPLSQKVRWVTEP